MRSTVSLLFDAGERPDACALVECARHQGKFSVSLQPAITDSKEVHWVELLAHGLTFDLAGLRPGPTQQTPDCAHRFGLPEGFEARSFESLSLTLGPHLATGGPILPLMRCMAWLAAQLTALPGLRAVSWNAAASCSEPAYFRNGVMNWIGGGAFPGLGLTALETRDDGALESTGLAAFTGQEVRLMPQLAQDQASAAKIALRLLHWLVENGKIDQPTMLAGPSGESLRLEPRPETGFVEVCRA